VTSVLHYIDLQLRPDPEMLSNQLMSALYGKLHRVLALTQARTIGVSFPGYSVRPPGLGDRLRLFGPMADLNRLMEADWMGGMRDHVRAGTARPVPEDAEYRTLQRVQTKSSPERLRRRQMRRHGLTEADARERVPDTAAEALNLPYVVMSSGSTGQRFPLFLRLGPVGRGEAPEAFNAYGLSSRGQVPWF
jgi:CRISPR-associated endonuclease Csy4